MGGAAGQDEGHEQIGYPAVADIRPTADELGDRQGDREIGQADDRVRGHVQADKSGRPGEAEAMRCQPGRVQEPVLKRHVLTSLRSATRETWGWIVVPYALIRCVAATLEGLSA